MSLINGETRDPSTPDLQLLIVFKPDVIYYVKYNNQSWRKHIIRESARVAQ